MGDAKVRVYRNGKLDVDGCPVADVSDHLADPDALVWVDYLVPDQGDLDELAAELELHELAVEDALNARQRPKLDVYDSHIFLAARWIDLDAAAGELHQTEVHAFANSRWIVTVRGDDRFDIGLVERRIDRSPDLLAHGAGFLLYAALDVIVDGYFTTVQAFDDFYDEISEGLFEDRPLAQGRQRQWFEMRRSLVRFHRSVAPLREAVSGLRHPDRELVAPALAPYYQDLYDHVIRVIESTDATRDLASTIMETNLSLRDYRQNQVMKQVTSWAAIVAVPTLITGFYGMNVPYPGFDTAWGVVASVVLMVVLSSLLYVQFKRRDWL